MRFLERFCSLFSDVPYGEISHSDVQDLASLSDDSFRSPVSLSNVPFLLFLKCLNMFKNCLKCLGSLVHLVKHLQT